MNFYTKTMPEDVKNQFLTICKQIDTITDQIGAETILDELLRPNVIKAFMDQIRALRLQRDQIASQYFWKLVV